MLLGHLVAQHLVELGGGQAVLAQALLIGLGVEAAGDLVEEGGDFLQLGDQQLVGGPDTGARQQLGEGLAGGDAVQHPAVEAVGGRHLRRDRLAGLLLEAGFVGVVLSLEVGGRQGARARLDHLVAATAGEDVVDAEHGEADDQQADQDGGDPGLGESADSGEHLFPFPGTGEATV